MATPTVSSVADAPPRAVKNLEFLLASTRYRKPMRARSSLGLHASAVAWLAASLLGLIVACTEYVAGDAAHPEPDAAHVPFDAAEIPHDEGDATPDQPIPSDGGADAASMRSRIDYLGEAESLADAVTYTFPAVALGDAGSDKSIVVIAHAATNAALVFSSVSLGGSSMQKVVAVGETSGPSAPVAMFIAPFTAASGDVTVTLDHRAVRCAIAVYAAHALASAAADDTNTLETPDAGSIVLSTLSGGLVIAAVGRGGTTSSAASWTGVTEAYDRILGSGSGTLTLISGAVATDVSSGPLEISVGVTSAGDHTTRLLAASFH